MNKSPIKKQPCLRRTQLFAKIDKKEIGQNELSEKLSKINLMVINEEDQYELIPANFTE